MKIKGIFLLLPIICVLSCLAHAQHEWESVFNARTGEYGLQYNPYNDAQQAYERQRQEIDDRADRQRRESNEQFRRQAEARQEMMRQQQLATMELNSRLNYGNAIIKAGKATTTFKVSSAFSLANYFLQKAKTPELRQMVEQYANVSLRQFQNELGSHGLSQTDYVDGKVLAFIICYEVYFGQKPSNAHLAWARQATKAYYLKDAYFQSSTDLQRQQPFESDGAMAMYAKTLYGKADANSLREAKSIAKYLLESIWSNSVNTILITKTGFIHRGRQIITDGKATNLFKYNPNINTPRMLVCQKSQFIESITQEYQGNLQQFYQAMAQKGGQKNDFAWCATISAYANTLVVTQAQDWNSAQFRSAYDFLKNAILQSPDIQAASDESKQIACETIAIRAASNYKDFLKVDSRAVAVAAAQKELGDIFRALNEDPNKYQWTVNGIVKVR